MEGVASLSEEPEDSQYAAHEPQLAATPFDSDYQSSGTVNLHMADMAAAAAAPGPSTGDAAHDAFAARPDNRPAAGPAVGISEPPPPVDRRYTHGASHPADRSYGTAAAAPVPPSATEPHTGGYATGPGRAVSPTPAASAGPAPVDRRDTNAARGYQQRRPSQPPERAVSPPVGAYGVPPPPGGYVSPPPGGPQQQAHPGYAAQPASSSSAAGGPGPSHSAYQQQQGPAQSYQQQQPPQPSLQPYQSLPPPAPSSSAHAPLLSSGSSSHAVPSVTPDVNWAVFALVFCLFQPLHDYNSYYPTPYNLTGSYGASSIQVVLSLLAFLVGSHGLHKQLLFPSLVYLAVVLGHTVFMAFVLVSDKGLFAATVVPWPPVDPRFLLAIPEAMAPFALWLAVWSVRRHEYLADRDLAFLGVHGKLDGIAALASAVPVAFSLKIVLTFAQLSSPNNIWAIVLLCAQIFVFAAVLLWRHKYAVLASALLQMLAVFFGATRVANNVPMDVFTMISMGACILLLLWLFYLLRSATPAVLAWQQIPALPFAFPKIFSPEPEGPEAPRPSGRATEYTSLLDQSQSGDREEAPAPRSTTRLVFGLLSVVVWLIQGLHWILLYLQQQSTSTSSPGSPAVLLLDIAAFVAAFYALYSADIHMAQLMLAYSFAKMVLYAAATQYAVSMSDPSAPKPFWNAPTHKALITIAGVGLLVQFIWIVLTRRSKPGHAELESGARVRRAVLDALLVCVTGVAIFQLLIALYYYVPSFLNIEAPSSVTLMTLVVAFGLVAVTAYLERQPVLQLLYFLFGFGEAVYSLYARVTFNDSVKNHIDSAMFGSAVFALVLGLLATVLLLLEKRDELSREGGDWMATLRERVKVVSARCLAVLGVVNVVLICMGLSIQWYQAVNPYNDLCVTETVWQMQANYSWDSGMNWTYVSPTWGLSKQPELAALYSAVAGLSVVALLTNLLFTVAAVVRAFSHRLPFQMRFSAEVPLAVITVIFAFLTFVFTFAGAMDFSVNHGSRWSTDWNLESNCDQFCAPNEDCSGQTYCPKWSMQDAGFPLAGPFVLHAAAIISFLSILLGAAGAWAGGLGSSLFASSQPVRR